MIMVLDVLLSAAAILLLIPVIVLFVQVIFAYLPKPKEEISREEISREEISRLAKETI